MADELQHINDIATFGKLPARDKNAHKGDFGSVLVAGGSRRMIGAPGLTANGALRGGAGLVTIASPAVVQLAVAMLCECATSIPLACDTKGQLASESVRQLKRAAETSDILAVGPGMGIGGGQENLLRAAIEQEQKQGQKHELKKPVVIDADGLNNLAKIDNWYFLRKCPLILTPHPGEFARLTGKTIEQIQGNRIEAVAAAIKKWLPNAPQPPMVLVLKGAETIVTDGSRIYINNTGNPGMATGGSGDVLTGLIAGIALQGPDLFTAACMGVYLHGAAGDLAAAKLTEESMIASDLLEFIPEAMKKITA